MSSILAHPIGVSCFDATSFPAHRGRRLTLNNLGQTSFSGKLKGCTGRTLNAQPFGVMQKTAPFHLPSTLW
jgi:hypothetical protein